MDQKATVATPTPRVEELEAKREMVRTIMGGTDAIRAACLKYIPRHPAEEVSVYKARITGTFLDNFVGQQIEKANGKLFSKPAVVDDAAAELEPLIADIDRQGNALHPFLMEVGKRAFQDGISFVFVDLPAPPKPGTVVTKEEEKALGMRPYAAHVIPSSILEALHEMISGVATLTRVRIMETVTEPDGEWGSKSFEQVRVWYRDPGPVVRWELYRREGDRKEWVMVDEGVTSFKRIHLYPFYTNRVGFCEGEPPFQDTAERTIEHVNAKSEHSFALSMCCFGMYTAVGVPPDPEFRLRVGPAKTHTCTNPDAKFGVLETTGKGVELSEKAIAAIESRIEAAGVNLRVENAGEVTATAAALDSEDTHCGLKAVAQGFSDSASQVLAAFAEIMGIDPGKAGTVKVNDDFGVRKGSDSGLVEVGKARALGDISRRNYLQELIRRGELAEDFDIDANSEELSAEGPALGMLGGGEDAGVTT